MEYHYKAFISYRHAELDSKVAVEIQNRIERYRIPGSIRRELGIKSIGRVFRDKDELPSTSDLNDNLKEAIRNSEYLICICSPRYIESIWCRKEIEFFLETHDKHHVLTVLAEGDPYEVVPDILCSEKVTVQDENGNDITIEAKLEPLSCDYRGDRHRARTEEFPRLAAVLIGCRYADLRQKLRKRKMRITAAVAAFAAALTAYFVWSYINIQNNYRKALINQSEYLASSARDALDDNDNILAAQLSLAALPDKGKDRPVVPEAVYTLSQAVGAYQARQTMNIRGVASYTTKTGRLSYYCFPDDAHYLAMLDARGDVEVCDLVENTTLYTISSYTFFGKAADRVISCSNDRFVLYGAYGNDDVAVINFSDGEVVWHQKFAGNYKRVIPLGYRNYASMMILTEEEAIIVSAQNGEILNRFSVEEVSGGEASKVYQLTYDSSRHCVSVNRENASCSILCASVAEDYTTSPAGVLTYYYETNKIVWTPYSAKAYQYEAISQNADGHILVAYAENSDDYSLNTYYASSNQSSIASYDSGRVKLVMLREGSGEVLWENSIEYMGLRESTYSCFEIRTLPGKKNSLDREVVLAAVSNKAALFDVKDGTKIREITLSDWIISVDEQDKEETFVRVNGASGAQYNFDCNSDTYSGIAFFGDQVDNVYFVHARNAYDGVSQFLVNNGYVIRVLKAEQGDDDYTLFGFETPETDLPTWYILGSTLVMADDNDKLYAYDMESEEKLWETQLDSEYYYDFLGLSKDHSRLFLTTSEDYNRCNLICVDLVQGTAEKINITENDFMTGVGKWKFDCSNSIVSGDYIYYRALNYNSRTSYWFRYSMADGSIAIVKLPYYEDIQYSTTRNQESAAVFSEDGSKGILYFDYAVYLTDFKSGTVTAIDASISGVKLAAYREKDGMFAFYEQVDEGESRKEIHVFDADGKLMWESRNLSEGITAMKFCRDSLIVATDNNRLYAYSAKNGKQEGMIEIGITINQNKAHLHDMGSSSLVLENGYGVMFMIDCENWALTGAAYDTVGFCPELKRVIITSGSSGRNIGYCPYYSVEDLVEKGKTFVGEQTLSEEDRAVYGVE